MVQLENSDVIGESSGVKLGVHVDADDVALYVRIKLDVVVYVPFAQSRAKIATGVGLHAVSSGDDVSR